MDYINELPNLALKIIAVVSMATIGTLMGFIFHFIRTSKESMDGRLDELDKKIDSLEKHIDQKTEFLVDKILNLAPEKEAYNSKLIKNSDRIILLERSIVEISKKITDIGVSVEKDMINFKKILIRFREELNTLHTEVKGEKN